MKLNIDTRRTIGKRDKMIYGHFIEHFHRQIYGGIFDPGNPLSDRDGFRLDVIEAMRKIKVPILRWPGGCFVSAHHWKDAVGPERKPSFDKAWRVEEPNTFGTDEYIAFCRKVGCEPYICTNAGTGNAEEMSDWVEYCNLSNEGPYAKQRISNGHRDPYKVRYWSIGNENYGGWEIGAKSAEEWGRLVTESAKMMLRVDPQTELSAAALADLDWNINLLRNCGDRINWISIHDYWDAIHQTNDYADYEQSIAYTNHLDDKIVKVQGILNAMGLQNKIRIAFDEWNLRGWYHPNIHTVKQGLTTADYLTPRDLNDENCRYTMADAVFTACFLNMCNRNCTVVGMANFAPVVNTRGCIFTHKDGIVLRSTYHVFDLYVNNLGETVLDTYVENMPQIQVREKTGGTVGMDALDIITTLDTHEGCIVVAAVNKDPHRAWDLELEWVGPFVSSVYTIQTLMGTGTESYNDINHVDAEPGKPVTVNYNPGTVISLPAHSVNIIRFANPVNKN
ncbi:alpha-L-arabinofuranosidase C-terminal domain-containing protein [Treponema primitia]|uniref:alpha-L-arabinofuranosidase C-terminal domain-containing protein n=1 Tax=Treponema primitia TaxID=88058 RepID=UPI0002554C9B|nr:alpha-L-arabinofuranosidase C-terminal domain-containing protein [Treponema primitia]